MTTCKVSCWLAALICGIVPWSTAQTQSSIPAKPFSGSIHDDLVQIIHRFPRDQADIFLSPVKLPHHPHAVAYVIPFAAAAAFIPFDKRLSGDLPRGHGGVSGTISNVGIGGTGAAVGALYIYGLLHHDEHAHETGLLGAESALDAVLPHAALNFVFGRFRPFQGSGEELGEGDFFSHNVYGASFPSGHALFTWAMANSIAEEYPSMPNRLLWYGVGTTVAISRVTARQHFASDVIVGSAIGYLIARHIFHTHHRER